MATHATLTTLSEILKTFYLPPIRSQLNDATVLLSQVASGKDQVSGQDVVTPLMYGFSQGVGARAEDATLPSAKRALHKQSLTQLKANYGRIQLSGHVIRATRDDRGAFVRAISSEIQNMVTGIKNDYNRQCFGDGTGAIATVSGAHTTSTTLTVTDAQYLREEMPVYIPDATAPSDDAVTLTNINDSANTATADDGITAANGSLIYRGESSTSTSKDNEIMGLKGIASNTVTLQNLAPATYLWWKPASINSSTTTLTFDTMQTLWTAVEKKAGNVDLIVTDYTQRDNYAALMSSQGDGRRWVNVMDLAGGFKGIEYNGIPIVPDKDCPTGYMFFLDTSVLSFQEKADWEWMDMDGSIWNRVLNKEAYEATILKESNLVTGARNRCAAFTALT